MMLKKGIFVLALAVSIVNGADIPKIQSRDNVINEWQNLASRQTAVKKAIQVQFGTAPVCDFKDGYVELPVNFKGTDLERANWDLPVDFDLTRSKGLSFDFFCAKMSAFVSFSLYLHVDGDWQQTRFSPGKDGQWTHIKISKSAFSPDAGAARSDNFKHVDRIRISGWRGNNVDTTCALANMSLIPFEPEVLLLSGVSCAKDKKDEKQYSCYANNLHQSLLKLGVESVIVDDIALDEKELEGIKVVAVSYNTSLPKNVMPALHSFVKRGGKVICFYTLSGELLDLMGVNKANWVKDASGHFSGFSRFNKGLKGQPKFAPQESWCAHVYKPNPAVKGGRVVAVWKDGAGKDTEHPAIVVTPTGAVFGHVWLRSSDPASSQLLMSLLGELAPSIWKKRATRAFAKIGRIEEIRDFKEFCATVKRKDLNSMATTFFKESSEAYRLAEEALDNEDWEGCFVISEKAQELAVKCWCSSYKSVKGEHRAFWCHSAFGLGTNNWDQSIHFLKEHGFNAILPNMSWGATAYYPSDVLPEYGNLAKQGDQIAQCLAACKKYGVECHVWKVCWNTGHRVPKDVADKLRKEQRLQVSNTGDDEQVWLCPSHPLNQQMEIDAMLEVARDYDVDGIHFDYIRYPGSHYCYCDGCCRRFGDYIRHKVEGWPESVKKGGANYEKWLEFRRGNISKVVREVALKARKIRKGIEISAAVFRNAESDRNTIGQDWQHWCEEGWLDFVCPMDYIDSTVAFSNVINIQKEHVAGVPLYPGIGLSCWKDGSNYAVKLCEQIVAVREAGLKGFTVFNYDKNAERVLPYLKLGVTKSEVRRLKIEE
ncbi:MAG: family 10 glycosylhydrolase [Kiritimatiellae bacterium]|nr:family 10 glycosylhydrolase [Kiritimatiellia bacterium]